jgi:hypothetical protein
MIVTDSTTYDRGLRRIVLNENDNFKDINIIDTSGRVVAFQVEVVTPGRSSVGRLEAIDVYGMMSPGGSDIREDHRASIDLAIWVQKFAFKSSTLAKQNETIKVPLNFVVTDTFSLYRKNIREFDITFDLIGDAGFSYAGFDQIGTSSEGFAIKETVNGNRVTLSGMSATPLTRQDTALLYVLIKCAADELTKETMITPVSIILNRGIDTVVTGKSSIAVLPAPYGAVSGGNLVAIGSCSPTLLAGEGAAGSVIYMEHARPNPFADATTLNFTVPEEGPISIVLYNSLGQQVKTIVDQTMSPGDYSVTLNAAGLPSGSYYARMQSANKVVSRNLRISR